MKKKKSLRDIFKTRATWIKSCLAKDKFKEIVKPESDTAVKWCLVGAVMKVYGDYDAPAYLQVTGKMADVIESHKEWPSRVGIRSYDPSYCCEFNNHPKTKFADIIELIEKAKV